MYVFIWKDKSSGLAFPYLKLDDIISLTSYLQICLKDQKANVTQLMHFRNLIATLIYFLVLLTETMMRGVKIVLRDFLELGGIVPATIQI